MIYLFPEWNNLKEALKSAFVYLFLDFDGTLTPLAETPGKVVFPEEAKELIYALSQEPLCKIAIISGRVLEDLKDRVGLKGIVYVGNHGFEIEGPKIKFKSVVPNGYKEVLKKIKQELDEKLLSVKGTLVEDKGYTLTLHYRLVDKRDAPAVEKIFRDVTAAPLAGNKIKITSGKEVFEIRPPMEWDKGKAVLWLLARQKFAVGKRTVIPIYIGDDITDEDAFRALKEKRLTVFVGESKAASYAEYYLKDVQDVMKFLREILNIKKGAAK